ncbi:uncharacterized protein LOC100176879 [Ciona intestinalis]
MHISQLPVFCLCLARCQSFKIKQGWNSSYSIDFKNWYASHYDDVRSKCATQTSEATDKEKLLTEEINCKRQGEDLEKKVNFQAKTPDPRVAERDRLIKEADDIEEKEFQALFGPGGKMKMVRRIKLLSKLTNLNHQRRQSGRIKRSFHWGAAIGTCQ